MKKLNLIAFLLFLGVLLSSCTSIKTIENPEDKDANGISYFMPMKDLIITIKTKADKNEVDTITITTTDFYPDYNNQYILKHSRNLVGKSTMDFTITTTGLLSSTKSINTSSVSQAFINLAKSSAFLAKNVESNEC